MPILQRYPWKTQYFEGVECPNDVIIPTNDTDAWQLYPNYRWVYDKLRIAHSQGLNAAPHGVPPRHFPVFSKPITNLYGMSVGSLIIGSENEMVYIPGHFWMDFLEGQHVSTDYAVVDGRVAWGRQTVGIPAAAGMFNYWHVLAVGDDRLDQYLTAWVSEHLPGYTGMINLESIGGRIIEAHLRFASQWTDLYGDGWLQALVRLYAERRWIFSQTENHEGYSVPLFAQHGGRYMHPSPEVQARIRATPGVTSLQISFCENKAANEHAMPPGGFRLCIVNCTNLEVGIAVRKELAKHFPGADILLTT